MRLYPLPFRYLDGHQFHKYDVIEVERDGRPAICGLVAAVRNLNASSLASARRARVNGLQSSCIPAGGSGAKDAENTKSGRSLQQGNVLIINKFSNVPKRR
jgi:hypothetical protein